MQEYSLDENIVWIISDEVCVLLFSKLNHVHGI